jgi:hypothetical protein
MVFPGCKAVPFRLQGIAGETLSYSTFVNSFLHRRVMMTRMPTVGIPWLEICPGSAFSIYPMRG